ncbi:tRNA-splicing endonuclease subunit Sen15 [Xylariaceae sp. FL0016]|nr:tRNA-splicing endonuclease subunit Sen15 [Xylariaceae sp. FL0016]
MMAATNYSKHLANLVSDNLQHQQDWTELKILTHQSTGCGVPFPRPLIKGLPPRRLYLHPDDQIAMIKAHPTAEDRPEDVPETEWVLPTHLAEKWTLKSFADIFDSLPPNSEAMPGRPKRILLATVHDDSTVVYYLMHDGIVKPRQN